MPAENATRPKSETRRRTRLVGVRLTPAEHATVEHGAQACGLSMPEFLRRVALPGGDDLLRRAATDECPNLPAASVQPDGESA